MLLFALLLWSDVCAPAPAERAYSALRDGRLDEAVSSFREASACDTANPRLHKDFAYALLKTGDRLGARDEFEAALLLDPSDDRIGLEFAFLSFETGRRREARNAFLKLKSSSDPATRAEAEVAFESVDKPLRENIARWQEALKRAPGQWSGHEELARLAERRDELDSAAAQFEAAWRLRPGYTDLLLDLARVWREQGKEPQARMALATAWRMGTPRVAETARQWLNGEIPAAGAPALAAAAVAAAEETEVVISPKEMGARSLGQSFLDDAYRYFTLARQQNPGDAEVIYQLGVVCNLLHRDKEALDWFDQARRLPGSDFTLRAEESYRQLRPSLASFGVTAWAVPLYSSRWNDAFLYGQVKAEWKWKKIPIKPYVSLRLIGDTRGRSDSPTPVFGMYLSETSLIAGLGVGVPLRSHGYGWFEAGEAISYLGRRVDMGLTQQDYRGGLSTWKGWGRLLGPPEAGWFAETNLDGVFISRFANDMLAYWQTRAGRTFARSVNGFQAQAFLLWNLTADRNGEYWGNFMEAGPGVRVRVPGMPRGMSWRAELVRGANLINTANPRRPNYWDARIGVWYAFAH